MPDSNIFKCKNKYKSATNNGSYNISDIQDLTKKEIASKKNMKQLMKNSLMMKQRVFLFNNNNSHILCLITQFPSITSIDKLNLHKKNLT